MEFTISLFFSKAYFLVDNALNTACLNSCLITKKNMKNIFVTAHVLQIVLALFEYAHVNGISICKHRCC